MQVVYRKLSELTKLAGNPRQIKSEDFLTLCKSLTDNPDYFDARPLILSNRTGEFVIIAGNQRFEAAKHNKLIEVPTFLIEGLTEAREREIVIRDNVNNGSWDWDILANDFEITDLEAWGVDLPLDWGEKLEAEEDDFEIPDVIETDIVLGDLFEIGEHRLLCGDSTCSDTVAKLMNGEKADMLTDPPYGINANNQTLGSGKKEFHRGENWDKEIPNFFYLISMFEKCIIWGGNYFADKLPISNDWLCWDKKNPNLSFSEFELAWSNIGKNCRIISHHWSGETKLHPTMKPVPVMAWCLSFLKSEIILDPFLGSGSTMVAAHQLKRKCYGMELDPKYCEVIVQRMKKLDPNLIIKKNGLQV